MDGQQEVSNKKVDVQQTNKAEKPLVIIVGTPTYPPKYESSIPRQVTDDLLQSERMTKELPALGSSTIEDFIIEQLRAGIAAPETIAANFSSEDIAEKVRIFAEIVRQTSERINWNETFTIDDARAAQARVLAEMQTMGMTSEQIARVASLGVDIAEGIGVSSYSEHSVYASRLQAVRRAIDYQKVFGTDVPLELIIKAYMTHTIGHELGHNVDSAAGIATNNIPKDENWKVNGNTEENKSERFAEFWGYVAAGNNPQMQQITRREWALQVAKVTQLWDAVANYSANHAEKADLAGIFRAISNKIDKDDNTTSSLFLARRALYSGNEVESYAASYPREVVVQAINSTHA